MLRPSAIAFLLIPFAIASAQPNPEDFDLPDVAADPLFHVEIIFFAFDEGDRNEEDFFHGIDDPRFEPVPGLLRLPRVELESVYSFRPEAEMPAAETATFDDAVAREEAEFGSEQPIVRRNDPSAAPIEVDGDAPIQTFVVEDGQTIEELLDALDPPIEPQDALELFELNYPRDLDAIASTEFLPEGFRPLAGDEFELGAVAARMNRRPYTLLGYAGWEQAGVDTDRSIELDLNRLGITNPTGTIEVSLRRFLRVSVDLEFFDGAGTLWTSGGGFGLVPFEYATSYKLVDERTAIRSGELHSLDHPLFGVIFEIRRAPEPEDETDEEDADGPAG